jgi:hypothetical protein
MISVSPRLRAAAAAVAAALLLTAAPRAAQPTPAPLGGVEQLKAWFNANKAHTRALLLLSPT